MFPVSTFYTHTPLLSPQRNDIALILLVCSNNISKNRLVVLQGRVKFYNSWKYNCTSVTFDLTSTT